MVTVVAAVHEEVDERARGEKQVREDPEHMRLMPFPEEERCDSQEDADGDCDRCGPR